jgi:hypothetical protein
MNIVECLEVIIVTIITAAASIIIVMMRSDEEEVWKKGFWKEYKIFQLGMLCRIGLV